MRRSCLLVLNLCPYVAFCTTKGLNQIVTPDIQPFGQLSISYQMQNAGIGNPYQIQYEYGITQNFEAAVFQGVDPGALSGAVEYGIVQRPDFLLSTGFVGWSNRGDEPQPFVEAGYYKGNVRLVGGFQRTGLANLGIAGAAYQANSKLLVQADYLGGRENYTTAGFTYSVTPNLTVNPALYLENTSRHSVLPYLVVSYTITVVKPAKK